MRKPVIVIPGDIAHYMCDKITMKRDFAPDQENFVTKQHHYQKEPEHYNALRGSSLSPLSLHAGKYPGRFFSIFFLHYLFIAEMQRVIIPAGFKIPDAGTDLAKADRHIPDNFCTDIDVTAGGIYERV